MPLQPGAAEKLRAKGRELPSPFPNSANQGRKFNPWGDTIPPLATAQEQRVLVIFVEFTTPPPGGPAMRVDLRYFDDMLFGETYDPPEYAGYPGHPTNRTLKNYFSEVSYGQVDIITVNMPSKLGWAQAGHSYDYYCPGDNGFGRYPNNAPGLVVDAVNAVFREQPDGFEFVEHQTHQKRLPGHVLVLPLSIADHPPLRPGEDRGGGESVALTLRNPLASAREETGRRAAPHGGLQFPLHWGWAWR